MDANGVLGSTEMGRKYRSSFDNPRPKTNLQTAKDFILRVLADGPLPSKEVSEKANEEGILPTYLKQAKRELTAKKLVAADRIEGSKNEWTWRLREDKPELARVTKEGTIDLQRTHHLCEDMLSVTMEERKKWGIKDNEQVFHVRDPRYWTKHEPQDPARAFLRQNAGSRIIYENGEMVSTGFDTILAVRPMEEVEKLRERERQQQIELEMEGKRPRRSDDFDRNTPNGMDYETAKHLNSEANMNAGMIGPQSPSSGVALEDYIRLQQLTAAQIEAEERLYSLGPHFAKVYSDEEAEAMEAANRRAGGRGNERGSGGKFFSLPPTIRPRNLAQR